MSGTLRGHFSDTPEPEVGADWEGDEDSNFSVFRVRRFKFSLLFFFPATFFGACKFWAVSNFKEKCRWELLAGFSMVWCFARSGASKTRKLRL